MRRRLLHMSSPSSLSAFSASASGGVVGGVSAMGSVGRPAATHEARVAPAPAALPGPMSPPPPPGQRLPRGSLLNLSV